MGLFGRRDAGAAEPAVGGGLVAPAQPDVRAEAASDVPAAGSAPTPFPIQVDAPVANAPQLAFDSDPEPTLVPCPDGTARVGTEGIVMRDGYMLARYRSHADAASRVVRFEVSFGPFGDDGSAGETFGVRFGETSAGVGFSHCDPHMMELLGAGRPVSEAEARLHVGAAALWQVVDFLYAAEPVMQLATRRFKLPRTVEELTGV